MASANPHLSVSNEAKEAAADPKKAVFKVPERGTESQDQQGHR